MVDLAGKDLNLLVALRALLEEGNVTRAGDRLQMGQSSMSSALSKLRKQHHDELLVRVGRDYELTPYGRQLMQQVQLALPLLEAALGTEGPFDPLTSKRTFRIHSSDYAVLELRAKLNLILTLAPGIRIALLPMPQQPKSSEREQINNDFIITVPGIGIGGESTVLFTDHYVCMVDKDNPALVDGKLTWDAFSSLPQAVYGYGQEHLTPADRHLKELGFTRIPRVRTSSFLPMPNIIAGTDLVALVPSRLVGLLGEVTGTIGVPTPFRKVDVVETLWWHPSHDSDAGHRWFRQTLTS